MTSIDANLQAVRERIAAACAAAGRDVASVTLLAVSKNWPADAVRAAVAAGQRAFAESYVQEAVAKIASLNDPGDRGDCGLEWHFIGPLQSNKTRTVAESFDWVHSVERLKIAERLSAQRPAGMAPLNICIQINVSGEESKSGCAPEAAPALAQAVAALPRLRLRGLMAIPEPTTDVALARRRFATLSQLLGNLNNLNTTNLPHVVPALDTLSMGMSHDLEAAIMEGATIVRVGTAIFGERDYA